MKRILTDATSKLVLVDASSRLVLSETAEWCVGENYPTNASGSGTYSAGPGNIDTGNPTCIWSISGSVSFSGWTIGTPPYPASVPWTYTCSGDCSVTSFDCCAPITGTTDSGTSNPNFECDVYCQLDPENPADDGWWIHLFFEASSYQETTGCVSASFGVADTGYYKYKGPGGNGLGSFSIPLVQFFEVGTFTGGTANINITLT
jgi:hypothetical protein